MSSPQLHDADDGAYWMQPPPNPATVGEPIWVDFRLKLCNFSRVDAVAGTAFVHINIVHYWTDPRLADWPAVSELPPRLWGPKIQDLTNAMGDMKETDVMFSLADPATGRMKRTRKYSGTVDNPMDLRNFPFDMDRGQLSFITFSDWLTLDGELGAIS